MSHRRFCFPLLITLALGLAANSAAPAATETESKSESKSKYFEIHLVDDETGRGVPLVILRTTNFIRYVTDSAGRIAFYEPGLMDQTVFFFVESHGYRVPADGFGIRGVRLDVEPGGKATVKIHRRNIAQRIYRITGGGIYRDSVMLGYDPPIAEPLLDAKVLGCDSVFNVVHDGKLYWFWGDTNRPSYPLGNFHMTGATSRLPADGALDPDVGVNFDYFTGKNGFVRPMAKMPGSGPTWATGITALTDSSGDEDLYAAYSKIEGSLTTYARGLARFNDETQRFEKIADISVDAPLWPKGHPFKHAVAGTQYVYFATPYPFVRVPATPTDYRTLDHYEGFTCLAQGSTIADPQLDRTEQGTLRYSWKRGTPPLNPETAGKLIEQGKLKKSECISLHARETGKAILAHNGSVYWNDFRRRWVMIFVQQFGESSLLGEVWYAEAGSPVGPWGYAVKLATHDRYDFYNPKQHPLFDARGGKTIYFEGTYVNTFSGHPIATPRYNYNQMMFKVRLDQEAMVLPVPIYRTSNGFEEGREAGLPAPEEIAFFALDRPTSKSIPIYQSGGHGAIRLSTEPPEAETQPTAAFYALPADVDDPPATTEPLYRCQNKQNETVCYRTASQKVPDGFQREKAPLCRVWKNPIEYTWSRPGENPE